MLITPALASLGLRKAPLDELPLLVGSLVPWSGLLLQGLDITHSAISQTLPGVHPDGDLGLIEPTGMFRRVVNLQSNRQLACQVFSHMLFENLAAMGGQVVHHQDDALGSDCLKPKPTWRGNL